MSKEEEGNIFGREYEDMKEEVIGRFGIILIEIEGFKGKRK